MLREISPKNVRQINGEPRRRWFQGDYFDLVVLEDDEGEITGFQLSYDKAVYQRTLTWSVASGFSHNRVDDGDRTGGYKAAPILVPDDQFDHKKIATQFREDSQEIEEKVAGFVYDKLCKCQKELYQK